MGNRCVDMWLIRWWVRKHRTAGGQVRRRRVEMIRGDEQSCGRYEMTQQMQHRESTSQRREEKAPENDVAALHFFRSDFFKFYVVTVLCLRPGLENIKFCRHKHGLKCKAGSWKTSVFDSTIVAGKGPEVSNLLKWKSAHVHVTWTWYDMYLRNVNTGSICGFAEI